MSIDQCVTDGHRRRCTVDPPNVAIQVEICELAVNLATGRASMLSKGEGGERMIAAWTGKSNDRCHTIGVKVVRG